MAPDGFGLDGDLEPRNIVRQETSVLKLQPDCGPCRIGYISPSQNTTVDENLCFHDNLPSDYQCEENIKGREEADGQILSSDNKGKNFARKAAKVPITIPSKRPRIDESKICTKNNESNDLDDLSGMEGVDPIRCTADKYQTISQKRVYDGKRADKKNCRASMKNKYESLASKAGLACSDTFSCGNSIHGIKVRNICHLRSIQESRAFGSHGVRSDINDMAKQFDELSLVDLLNGSYRYPILPADKGKKSSNANDNILLSVRKACSILCPPTHVLAENSSNSKACHSSQGPSFSIGSTTDYETRDKQLEESLKKSNSSFVQDTFQANCIRSTMYRPKEILDQLALPSSRELETFLFNPSVCSVPSQSTTKSRSYGGTNLTPFHWSFSHGANSKSSIESCKVNAAKNSSQGKWVRIGSSSLIMGDKNDKILFPGLVFTSYGDDMDSLNQQKIDQVREWIESFTSTLRSPEEGSSIKFGVIGTHPEVQVKGYMNSNNGPSFLGRFNSSTFQPHDIAHTLSSSCLDCDSKGHHASEEGTASISRCPHEMNLDPSKFNSTVKDKAVLKDHIAGTIDDFFVSSFSCTCRNLTSRSYHSLCPYCSTLKCKQAYPQELLSAAATLLEMRRCHTGLAKCSSGRNRWPKATSMKKMKARKSTASITNPDRSFAAAGCNNLIRKANIPSVEHQPAIQRKMDFIPPNSCGRESSRWSSSSSKVEKDINQRVAHGNNSFRPLLTSFSLQAVNKDCDNQIKEPHAKLPSVTFKGSSIRDWIRCRNKRL